MMKKLLVLAACFASCLVLAGGIKSRAEAKVAEAEITADTPETPDTAVSGAPAVYFTSNITAEGLVKIYDALGWTPEGNVAVKISTGEPPASNYLRPELIGDLVKK